MRILALPGKRRAGKTTAAHIVKGIADESFGIKVRILSFGFPLKQMYSRQYGTSIFDLDAAETKEQFRKSLIDYANALKKENPYLFVDMLAAHANPGDNIVIDDVRNIEELQWCIENGGKPYRVEADKQLRIARGAIYDPLIDDALGETELDFSSETWRILGGGVIYNNKTTFELKESLFKLTKAIYVPSTISVRT